MMPAEGPSPTTGSPVESDPLITLKVENERLIALLKANGIDWRTEPVPAPFPAKHSAVPEASRLSTSAKVALFRRLFRGRTDAYPVRWRRAASSLCSALPWPNQ